MTDDLDFTASFLQGSVRRKTGRDPVLIFQTRPRGSGQQSNNAENSSIRPERRKTTTTTRREDSTILGANSTRTNDQALVAAETELLSSVRLHEPRSVEHKRAFLVYNNHLPVTSQGRNGDLVKSIPKGQTSRAAIVAAVHQRQFLPRSIQELSNGALKRMVVYDKPLRVAREESVDEIVSRERAARIDMERFGMLRARTAHTRKLAALTAQHSTSFLGRVGILRNAGPREFFRAVKEADDANKASEEKEQ